MALRQILTIYFFIGSFVGLLAQPASLLKYEFFGGIGGTNLMGDISAPRNSKQIAWVKLFNTVGFSGNVGLRYNFAKNQNASINLTLGQLYAEDPIGDPKFWNRGWRSSTFFTEFSGRYEYTVVKERQRRTVYKMLGESMLKNFNLPTYLFIGVGGLYNIGKLNEITEDGTSNLSAPYSNFTVVIPYGIGFKTRLTRLSYINVEVGLRFALNDGIDNKTQGKPGIFGSDQYQFININYVKKLKSTKNGAPKFRF